MLVVKVLGVWACCYSNTLTSAVFIFALCTEVQCSLGKTACDFFSDKEAAAEAPSTSNSATDTGAGVFAAHSPAPVGPEPSASKERKGEGVAAQAGGEDKEDDAAAVTAVIWKELAELSAVQAKLKVSLLLVLLLPLLFVGAGSPQPGGERGGGPRVQPGFGNAGVMQQTSWPFHSAAIRPCHQACTVVLSRHVQHTNAYMSLL